MSRTRLTPEQEAEAKHLEAKISIAIAKEVADLARLLVSKDDKELFGTTEFQVRDLVLRMGAKAYSEHLRKKKRLQPIRHRLSRLWPKSRVPGLSSAQTLEHPRADLATACLLLLPPLRWPIPLGQDRGFDGQASDACGRGTGNSGRHDGREFSGSGRKIVAEDGGAASSESSVQRTSEAAGKRLRQVLQKHKVLGGPTPWDWHKNARGKTCAYVSIDATGVRQQASGGGKADGRMPYVAMVFNPVPDLPKGHPYRLPGSVRMQARYLSGLYTLEEMGELLRRQAGQVGMNRAEQWIGLTDGGNGLENFLKVNFPGPLEFGTNLELILDFWHAADSLLKLAKTLYPISEEERQGLMTTWCHFMKHEGGGRIVAELEKLILPARKPAVQAQYEETLGYLKNNIHRMDYPRYVANGWSIGSGAVESACKTVVGQRLKLGGMRWRENGTDEMCQMRALYRSESRQWELFWSRSIK